METKTLNEAIEEMDEKETCYFKVYPNVSDGMKEPVEIREDGR